MKGLFWFLAGLNFSIAGWDIVNRGYSCGVLALGLCVACMWFAYFYDSSWEQDIG